MIEAKILNLAITDKGFAIIMKTSKSKKVIPIFIAPLEAQSIMTGFLYLNQSRPLTHDLIKSILDSCSIKLVHILIDTIHGDTFHAKLVLESGGKTILIDSRPSDAIAMSLRARAPIFVEESVLESAGVLLDEAQTNNNVKETVPFTYQSFDKELNFGGSFNDKSKTQENSKNKSDINKPENAKDKMSNMREQLDIAIREERYEDAAKLRDEIEKLK